MRKGVVSGLWMEIMSWSDRVLALLGPGVCGVWGWRGKRAWVFPGLRIGVESVGHVGSYLSTQNRRSSDPAQDVVFSQRRQK